jgi:sugar phosphate isomerase/epimerase
MLTISDYFGYDLPLGERFRIVKEAGFDGVLLGHKALERGEGPALARRLGLWVENYHAPFENINSLWLDTLEGEALTEQLLACLEACRAYEIPTMVLHLTSGDTPPPANGLGRSRLLRLAGRAEALGVNLALENLRKPEYLAFAFAHADTPRVGFCFDIGHQNCYAPDADLLALYGHRLMALHLHDNQGVRKDQHLLPFDGTLDWPAVMAKIAAAGYAGPVALEVHNQGYEQAAPEAFAGVALARGQRLRRLAAAV